METVVERGGPYAKNEGWDWLRFGLLKVDSLRFELPTFPGAVSLAIRRIIISTRTREIRRSRPRRALLDSEREMGDLTSEQ